MVHLELPIGRRAATRRVQGAWVGPSTLPSGPVRRSVHRCGVLLRRGVRGILRPGALVLAGLVALAGLPAHAQIYPAKPVRLVVGYPPGGSGDFLTRLIGDELAHAFSVPVVVDNRPGAGGAIAAELVAKAPADGYTVLNASQHAINKVLYRSLAYDGERDFVPVTMIARGPTVVCVGNASAIRTLADLAAAARARPGQMFNAGSGFGSAPHIAAVMFEAAAGVKFSSVQFKGGGAAAQSLLAGDTEVMFATPPSVMGFIRAGRMRAIAVSSPEASPAVPGVPGAAAAGQPGYESTFWFGLYLPAGTPRPLVERLHQAAVKILTRPEIQARIAQQGMDAAPSASPEAFAAQIRAEAPLIEQALRQSGIQAE